MQYLSHQEIFLDNKYTRCYYRIIQQACQRYLSGVTPEYTERHHIIPYCFFKNNRSNGQKPGWLSGDASEKSNLVRLTAKEHFVCHWLLTKMVTGQPQILMEYAFSSLGRITGRRDKLSALEYLRIKTAQSLSKSQTSWYHCGTQRARFNVNHVPEGWVLGWSGSSPDHKGKLWYNNGIDETKCYPGEEPTGWERGRVNSPGVPYHNGVITKRYVPGQQPPGWVRGFHTNIPESKWFTNGSESKLFAADCVPSGWRLGRHNGHTNNVWYHKDGVSKRFPPTQAPNGWIKGRPKWSRTVR